jgi:hypothetical protein
MVTYNLCSWSSETEYKNLFQELLNIYLSRDIKSVSELYGQYISLWYEVPK